MVEEFSEIVKKADRVRHSKYVEIMLRATALGYMGEQDAIDVMMDIESADKKFNLRLEDVYKRQNKGRLAAAKRKRWAENPEYYRQKQREYRARKKEREGS